jgi:hypothetical protein
MDAGKAEGRLWMYRRAVIVSIFLIGAGAATAAHADKVTTYGAGLKSCEAYLEAKEQQSADEVAFIDWLGGYLSGVNATSNHMNNILGDSNLTGAVYWLGNYCRAHPHTPVAVALDVLAVGARSTTARQTVEVTTYGAGFKACGTYLDAREQQNADEAAFIDWLGGYLSGVNAMSLSTNNILGDSDLTGAISSLDNYCRANPGTRFVVAVATSVASNRRDK